MSTYNSRLSRFRRRWFPEGERVVASIGVLVAVTLALAVGASAWWVMRVQARAEADRRATEVRVVNGLLSGSLSEMLSSGNLAGARRLLSDTAATHNFTSCRLTLGDGTVLADTANAKNVNLRGEMPEKFPALKNEATGTEQVELTVAGRGSVLLELQAGAGPGLLGDWEAQVGVGLIALVGFGGLLASYRLMRTKLRALEAIRGALFALSNGETSGAALRVGGDLGPDATAWNKMLDEREQLRQTSASGKAGEKLSARPGRESDLSSGIDAMWHGVLFVDEGLKVRFCNGAAAVLLGTKREALTGAPVGQWVNEAPVVEAISNVVSGKARGKTVVEIRRPGEAPAAGLKLDDGADRRGKPGTGAAPVVLRFSIRPMRREDSASVIVVIEDVTQQRVADEARNGFVSQAAHELRTPLTNIRLYVEQLVDVGNTDEAARQQAINVISAESRRLERIVADMLSVSEIEAGCMKLHRGDCRLAALFEELEHDYKAAAGAKEIELKFEMPPKLPVLHGDRDKIVMALHNLLGNAIKYTPSGGQVTVRVRSTGTAFEVEVIDNGIGIREEEAELVFEKFYRSKDRRIANITGSGIGLALAREVVRLHGGDITLRSQIDKGSTFTLSLPCQAQAA